MLPSSYGRSEKCSKTEEGQKNENTQNSCDRSICAPLEGQRGSRVRRVRLYDRACSGGRRGGVDGARPQHQCRLQRLGGQGLTFGETGRFRVKKKGGGSRERF